MSAVGKKNAGGNRSLTLLFEFPFSDGGHTKTRNLDILFVTFDTDVTAPATANDGAWARTGL
jgi:hypothetical protein